MESETDLKRNIDCVLEELSKIGYCRSTIHNYKKVYERLLKSADRMQTDTLSHDLAEYFERDSAHTRTGQFCHSRYALHKICIRMLKEYEEKGCVGWKPRVESKVDKPGSVEFQGIHTRYLEHLRGEMKSKNTLASYRNISCKFLIFIEQLGYIDVNTVPPEYIHQFFQWLRTTWEAGSLRTAAAGLRSFLQFVECENRLLKAIPSRLLRKRVIIPVLTPEEEQAVWDVLQTDVVSSRNKAIMLLSLLTGLRAVDIVNLRLADIDWRNDVITICQKKTKESLTLPLLPAIGNALVKYILDDRPSSQSPYVFLSYHAPHHPLKEHSSCYAVVRNIFSVAGVRLANELKGTRLLRHHIASKMLRNGVAIQTISSTLGHVNPNSTDIYLTTDDEKLRSCALTLSVIPLKVEGLTR